MLTPLYLVNVGWDINSALVTTIYCEMLCSRNSKFIESMMKDIWISNMLNWNTLINFQALVESEILAPKIKLALLFWRVLQWSCLSTSSKAAAMNKTFAQYLTNIFIICYDCGLFQKECITESLSLKQNFDHLQIVYAAAAIKAHICPSTDVYIDVWFNGYNLR